MPENVKTVEKLLAEMEEILGESQRATFSNLVKVDPEEIFSLITEIRSTLPIEFAQAKAISTDRAKIINDAKEIANQIIEKANEEAARLVSVDAITEEARKEAAAIVAQARDEAAAREAKSIEAENIRQANSEKYCTELRKNAESYVEGMMLESAKLISTSIQEFKSDTQHLEARQGEISGMLERYRKTMTNRK